MVNGDIPEYARELLFSARLLAFKKPNGGIRPIEVRNYFRRLAAKVASILVSRQLGEEFFSKQMGVSIQNGCEAAVHAARRFFTQKIISNECIGIKFDITNAFNSLRKDKIMESCWKRAPKLFPRQIILWGRYVSGF